MPADLQALIHVRSRKVREVLDYLDRLATEQAALPAYFPQHLRAPRPGEILPFDTIRQQLLVIEERDRLNQAQARVNEQSRTGDGFDDERIYSPRYGELRDGEPGATEEKQPVTFRWDRRAVFRQRRMVILGDPGYGKSWLLKYEARRWAMEQARQLREQRLDLEELTLPVFAHLNELATAASIEAGLEQAVCRYWSKDQPPRFLPGLLREKLAGERCLLLLDAYDEVSVPSREVFVRDLRRFFDHYPQPRVLLSSRIVGYVGEPLPRGQEVELLGFDARQSRAVAEVWFADQPDQAQSFRAVTRNQPAIRQMLRIPLLLNLALRTHQYFQTRIYGGGQPPDYFPSRRAELYAHCLSGLLTLWREEKHATEEDNLAAHADLDRLARAAFALAEQGLDIFRPLDLQRALGDDGEDYTPETSRFVDRLLARGVLVRTAVGGGSAPLMFLHRTFHEYLAARHLANRARREGWRAIEPVVEAWSWEPERDVILELLAGELDDPEPLLKHLANPATDGYFRGRLALAARCVGEIGDDVLPKSKKLIETMTADVWKFIEARKDKGASGHMRDGLTVLLRKTLASENDKGVITATFGSAEIAFAELMSWLSADGYSKVTRQIAVKALGSVATNRSANVLVSMLKHDDYFVRWRAVETLGYDGSNIAAQGLIRCLEQDASDTVRGSAAKALGQIDARQAVETLIRSLSPLEEEYVRLWAANALGEMAAESAVDALMETLQAGALDDDYHDECTRIRESATEALVRIGSDRVANALMQALRDRNPKVRCAAADALGGIRWDNAKEGLVAALHDENGWVRRSAARALGHIGSAHAVESLVASLDDEFYWVRKSAAEALGLIAVEAALNPLLAKLADGNGEKRAEAAEALGFIGLASAVAPLTAMLHDPHEWARYRAVEALGLIGSLEAVEPLLAVLGDKSDEGVGMRVRSAEALGLMGAVDAVDALIASIEDDWSDVRCHAAEALGRIGSEQAVQALVALLYDEEYDNPRVNAAEALGHIGSNTSVEALVIRLDDWLSEKSEWGHDHKAIAKALIQIGTETSLDVVFQREMKLPNMVFDGLSKNPRFRQYRRQKPLTRLKTWLHGHKTPSPS